MKKYIFIIFLSVCTISNNHLHALSAMQTMTCCGLSSFITAFCMNVAKTYNQNLEKAKKKDPELTGLTRVESFEKALQERWEQLRYFKAKSKDVEIWLPGMITLAGLTLSIKQYFEGD